MMSKWRTKAAMIVAIAVFLTLASLYYQRLDRSGCNEPDNPLAGITACGAHGPATYRGWPVAITYANETQSMCTGMDALEECTTQRHYIGFAVILELAFYGSGIALMTYLYHLVRKK